MMHLGAVRVDLLHEETQTLQSVHQGGAEKVVATLVEKKRRFLEGVAGAVGGLERLELAKKDAGFGRGEAETF